MLSARVFRLGPTVEDIPVEHVSEVVNEPDVVVWVDAADPSDAELAMIAEEFELHPQAMEDVHKHNQRPKLERYPTHGFVVIYSAEFAEVDVFMGDGWMVTVRERAEDGAMWDCSGVLERLTRTMPVPRVGIAVHAVIDQIVDSYFDVIDRIEDHLEDMEDRIFGDEIGNERDVQRDLFQVRRDLVRLRRVVLPLREVMSAVLRQEVPAVSNDQLLPFQDVYDHVLRAVDLIDAQRELMASAVDAHLAIISNRINQVMKKMTSWGAILFGASLIAGIYGMNFTHMPELSWRFGYPIALATMLVLCGALYVEFRRRDWL